MNKAVAGLIAALVLGSGVFVLVGNSDEESTTISSNEATSAQQNTAETQNQTNLDITDSVEVETVPVAVQAGSYVQYSDTAVADASGTKRVLFFHAQWCSTCKFFENEIKSAGVPEGITIIEADFDNDTALKEQYDVSVQSTFVLIDENGAVLKTWPFASGLSGAQELFEEVQAI